LPPFIKNNYFDYVPYTRDETLMKTKQIIKTSELDDYINYQSTPSPWHTVTQPQINQFADCTLDHQFIHVDVAKAKTTPFGSTIAHGFLTLSMISFFAEHFSVFIEGFEMGLNLGFDKVRFIQPVKVGSRIRASTKIQAIEEVSANQFRFKTLTTIEIEHSDKPALVAEWLTLQRIK